MAQIAIREHATKETNEFGLEVEKSLNQDMVFVNGKLAGYLTWADKCFKPLCGIDWDNAHNPMICKALEDLKGPEFGAIKSLDAITLQDMQSVASEDDDE